MKTIEELKGMTQEELIALVQELLEDNERQTNSSNYWYKESQLLNERCKKAKSTIKFLAEMIS